MAEIPSITIRVGHHQVLILDDIGYVQYSRDEMEVLLALLAEGYERGSVMLTSNLPFSRGKGGT